MGQRWLITAWYVAILISIIGLAKLFSIVLSKADLTDKLRFLLIAPALSLDSWKRARTLNRNDLRRLLAKSFVFFPAIVAVYIWLPTIISQPWLSWFARAYLAVIPLWLLTETISLITQLSFLPAKILVPSTHEQPWRSRTLAEFWGRRWNRLFADWFRQVCFKPFRNTPSLGLVLAFAVSGVIHEALVNVPLWLVFGRKLFGSMCLYFLIQAGGILGERHWFRQNPIANRLFLWAAVLGPVPLVLNEGALRIFPACQMNFDHSDISPPQRASQEASSAR
jgi:hypothetical protein